MNVKRFTARTSRDALSMVRLALGSDVVVLSTKPCAAGVEVLAMAPEGMRQIEHLAASTPVTTAPAEPVATTSPATPVSEDVERLSMSTLSFQDYVRTRMLKRRQAALGSNARTETPMVEPVLQPPASIEAQAPSEPPVLRDMLRPAAEIAGPVLADVNSAVKTAVHTAMSNAANTAAATARRDQQDMMSELRSVKGLIEERFSALAFMEKLHRQPGQARLTQKLLDCGFSPALIRKLSEALPQDEPDEAVWAADVLERNLMCGDREAALEDQGGVYALVGATGVGKTTSTAKLAAAFATKYGAANLGLITLDAYRVGAHEQLRAYGRILGVPVHTAHDRASLEDLLELLAAKKMVLIDTAGIAQRDTRTRELLDMLQHRSIQKLLVVNVASQGETIEDVMVAYRAASCSGVVLSKMDEAVKLGPALDTVIRHKLKIVGVANGQRVPEDWHRLSANALVHRALRGGGSMAYRLDSSDVSLIFSAVHERPASTDSLHV
jgi:flagellar biosynthesis protein FlhF